jgi:hypothetical protein
MILVQPILADFITEIISTDGSVKASKIPTWYGYARQGPGAAEFSEESTAYRSAHADKLIRSGGFRAAARAGSNARNCGAT